MKIQDYIQDNIIVTDGAMGTWFDQLEPENYLCSEAANFLNPDLIMEIHDSYIKNGAVLIRSNTFSANRNTLEKIRERHGGVFKTLDLTAFVKAGYEIAKKAAMKAEKEGREIFAAADIGPVYENSESETEEILAQYYELADIFIDAGADIFVLETFPDEEYVIRIAAYIKSKKKDAFVIGQFSFVPTGYGSTGHHYKNVLRKAVESEWLDAAGFNCGIGAAHMEKFYKEYFRTEKLPPNAILTALPNCGYPHIIRGRAVYSDSVSYFGNKVENIAALGVRILGGCCGTTPEYIEEISRRLKMEKEKRRPIRITAVTTEKESAASGLMPENMQAAWGQREKTENSPGLGNYAGQDRKEKSPGRKNIFREKLEKGEPVCALELDPPFDASAQKMMDGAMALKETKVDVITIADSPLARARADSLLMAAKIQKDIGISVMPHLSCRDRNRIAVRSGLLGVHISEVRNLLVVTGDPVGRDEREFTKSVFDFNSIKMMRYIRSMNEEMFQGDELFYGGALNQNGANIEKIADRMKKKIDAGCQFFLTQPVYSAEDLERLAILKQKTGAKILIGIMPLVSFRNALFIKNEMPGILVPDEVLQQYSPEGTREAWEETAVKISGNLMRQGKEIGAGYYLMTPFHRVSLMKRLLSDMV